jgi:ribosomal protein S18 acetylase RimI-like enzyme
MLDIRAAGPGDVELIAAHRVAMFEAMSRGTESIRAELGRNFAAWLAPRLADGRYLGWITTDAKRPVASAGLIILDWPPVPHDPAGTTRGYLLNIFVDAEYRRRGLARALVEQCIAETRRRGMRVVTLHASLEGRGLYEKIGFHAGNEMQLWNPEN